jgi:hypothetical protein
LLEVLTDLLLRRRERLNSPDTHESSQAGVLYELLMIGKHGLMDLNAVRWAVRCRVRSSRTGRPCRRWAIRGVHLPERWRRHQGGQGQGWSG